MEKTYLQMQWHARGFETKKVYTCGSKRRRGTCRDNDICANKFLANRVAATAVLAPVIVRKS